MVKFDTLLNDINGFGKYQKLRYALICVSGLLPPLVVYLHSFIAANPAHRCTHPDIQGDSFSSAILNYTNSSSILLEKCKITLNGTTSKCGQWVFDKTYYKSTITEEWGMVCDKASWRATVQTIYFSGVLIGSLVLGVLSDRFGRRPIMLVSFIMFILGGFGIAFGAQKAMGVAGGYAFYAVCRFIVAVATRGINVTGYILGVELVSSENRTFAGFVFQYFFPAGQLVLVAIAYFIRDWRTLAIVTASVTVPFLSYYFILPESPRWLLSKHREAEAQKILKKVAKTNGKDFNDDLWNKFIAAEAELEDEGKMQESIIHVFKSPSLAIITVTLFFHWIVNNFVFYGVGLISNDLGLNPYLTFAISASFELISIIITHFILDRMGRKRPYGIFLFMAGVSCLSIVFIHNTIGVVCMAMIGKFFVAGSYAAIYLYSSEIFPTSVRNSCLGSCSMMARIGAMVAPLINGLGEDTWKKLPFLVFGLSGIIAGITTLILPETQGRLLPRDVEEAEKMSAFKCFRKGTDTRVGPKDLKETSETSETLNL